MEHKFLIDKVNGFVHMNDKKLPFSDFFKGGTGVDGKSALELWRENGNPDGTLEEYMVSLQGIDGSRGEGAISVLIESTGGNFFKKDDPETAMTAVMAIGGTFMLSDVYNPLRYEWRCNGVEILVNENMEHVGLYNGSDVPYGMRRTVEITGSTDYQEARTIIVGNEDVHNKALYTCNVFDAS